MREIKFKQLIEREIDWSLKHPATNLSKQFQKGYLAGLQQTIYLLEGVVKSKKEVKSE